MRCKVLFCIRPVATPQLSNAKCCPCRWCRRCELSSTLRADCQPALVMPTYCPAPAYTPQAPRDETWVVVSRDSRGFGYSSRNPITEGRVGRHYFRVKLTGVVITNRTGIPFCLAGVNLLSFLTASTATTLRLGPP